MADPCAALEFPVTELASTAVYAIRFRGRISADQHERLQEYWRRAWEQASRRSPPLIVLDSDLTNLMRLDDELRPVGILRVEASQ